MLKTVIKVRICCPVVFYEEITAAFKLKKTQIGTEIDTKNQNFQTYQVFLQFLSNL